ncbi:MAG: GNAT family N-acetyltransferase [Rhodospirillales bacterium]|nr:GNAT family N-acetyltransferase [Rhodospirillales bacterium]
MVQCTMAIAMNVSVPSLCRCDSFDGADGEPGQGCERLSVDGEWVVIRPIRPADTAAHRAFLGRLTPEDLRFRFFSGVREVPEEQIVRFTSVDHESETALIAVSEASGETVGVARLALLPAHPEGEFAIVVQPGMKRKGLGTELMRRLVAWARAKGLGAMIGEVLADNAEMLRFVRHLGFQLRHEPEAPEVVQVRLPLAGPGARPVTGAFVCGRREGL